MQSSQNVHYLYADNETSLQKTKGIMIRFIDSIAPSIAVALRIPVYLVSVVSGSQLPWKFIMTHLFRIQTMCEASTGFHKRCLAIIYSKVTDDTVRLFEREICCKQGDFADIFGFVSALAHTWT